MPPPGKTTQIKAGAGASPFGQMNAATQVAAVVMMAAVLLVIYYMLLYSPLAKELETETSRRGEVQNALTAAQRDLRRYNDDVAQLERLRAHARELQRVLPDNADIPGFMRNINTLAEASGLQITLIQPDAERPEQYYVRVPVRLEVTGTYLALARFFRSVSQLPRVINMENIALTDPTEEQGEVRLKARILATTFRSLNATEQAAARRSAAPARPAGAAGAGAGGRR